MTASARPLGLASDRPLTVPRHVAIIMDGNGRWAKQRHLPRLAGHRAGTKNIRRIVETSVEFGVEVLTLYAFSTENWQRPNDEVADRLQADAVVHDLRPLVDEVVVEELHQRVHLIRRALPVLRRERVQRERAEADLARAAHDIAHALRALAVAVDSRQLAPARPAAVAVHDDRHVSRQRPAHVRREYHGGPAVATARGIP